MKRKILIGVAGGALALALAGGAVYAGPSLNRSLAATQAAPQPPSPAEIPPVPTRRAPGVAVSVAKRRC